MQLASIHQHLYVVHRYWSTYCKSTQRNIINGKFGDGNQEIELLLIAQ